MRVAEKKSFQADEIASAEVERPCIFKNLIEDEGG